MEELAEEGQKGGVAGETWSWKGLKEDHGRGERWRRTCAGKGGGGVRSAGTRLGLKKMIEGKDWSGAEED